MVKLKEIKDFLESLVPLELQDGWDNSGLQVGSYDDFVSKVGFALSVSLEVIGEAKKEGVNLIITHHPITISGLKSLTPHGYPSLLFFELLRAGISVYSLHTNLDVSPYGPTAYLAREIGLDGSPIVEKPPYGVVGELKEPASQRELLNKLTSFLPEDAFRVVNYKPELKVKKVAICSGSGASFIDEVFGKVDLYITGDIKYHDALKALDYGLTVFDMGHFGTERLFFVPLRRLLLEAFPSLDFVVLDEKSPFEVVRDVK
ncbi:Nif3-like dinuclear metal center hexameric protein [Thermovibrio sp.]